MFYACEVTKGDVSGVFNVTADSLEEANEKARKMINESNDPSVTLKIVKPVLPEGDMPIRGMILEPESDVSPVRGMIMEQENENQDVLNPADQPVGKPITEDRTAVALDCLGLILMDIRKSLHGIELSQREIVSMLKELSNR